MLLSSLFYDLFFLGEEGVGGRGGVGGWSRSGLFFGGTLWSEGRTAPLGGAGQRGSGGAPWEVRSGGREPSVGQDF